MTEPAPHPSNLAERYAAPAPWRRRSLMVGVALVAAAFLVWVVWVAWVHGTPAVNSELIGRDVQSDNVVVARVAIQLDDGVLDDGVRATCRVRAFAEDHTTVGEVSFTAQQGVQDVEIRTERRATSVELIGCTTPDQLRPR